MIKPCGQIRLQLLEHLYGLLEEADGRALTEHVEGCSICQAEMARAQEHMALISAAAKEEFPNVRFVPPVTEPMFGEKSATARRISPIGLRWAVAAMILLAIGGLAVVGSVYWQMQAQVAQAESNLRQVKDEIAQAESLRLRIIEESTQIKNEFKKQVDLADREAQNTQDALVRVGQDYQQKLLAVRTEVNAKQLDLTVIGPRTIQPGGLNQFQVQTRSLRGQEPIPAQINVRVHDRKSRVVFKDENVPSRGNLVVSLPRDMPLKSDSILTLEVEARADLGQGVTLTETLPLTEPVYVTHLSTDKPMYQPGEIVRFRSLTLERFSLRPADEDMELNYRIRKPTGEETMILRGTSQVGLTTARGAEVILGPDQKPIRGIGVGEYAIEPNAPTGEYSLIVTESRQRFPLQARRFWVYRPAGKNLAPQTAAGPNREIPGDLKKLTVEFFPEGGDLVARVPNRVYFQARTSVDPGPMMRHLLLDRVHLDEPRIRPDGPIDLKGRIVDEAGKEIVPVTTITDTAHPEANLGMGVFEFSPQFGKTYQLKIDTPPGMAGSHALPAVKAEGVVMSIPKGVANDKESIRVTVRSVGADRSLLVEAYCRGRRMGHQTVDVKKEEVKEVVLGPENGVGGVYRVTVFERVPNPARGEQLVPRAERLIYRSPANQLHLAIRPDKQTYTPGESVHVGINATDENGQPQPAVALAAVVDQKLLELAGEKTYRSMPAFFLLTTELRRPEDLENADFLLGDGLEAAKSLDLLLGTQGWRRFAEQDPAKFQKEQKADAQRLLALEGQSPQQIVNYGQEAVQKVVREFQTQYALSDKQLTLAEDNQTLVRKGDTHLEKLKQLQEEGNREETERIAALDRAKNAQDSLAVAAGNFQHYREFLRDAVLPIILGLFLLATVVNLILAFSRRWQGRAVPYLAGAACSLMLVALVMIQKATLRLEVSTGKEIQFANLAPLDNAIAQLPAIPKPDLPQQGLRPPGPPGIAPLIVPNLPTPDKNGAFSQKSRQGVNRSQAIELPLLPLLPTQPKEDRPQNVTPDQPASRDHRQHLPQMPVPAPPPPPFFVREYAHLHIQGGGNPGQDLAYTLYWHPVLVLPDGHAEFSFDLSNSEGRYRILVAGHTLDGRLGEGTAELKVQKGQVSNGNQDR
jgi:hypothetical protein